MSGCDILLLIILFLVIIVIFYILSLPSIFAQRFVVECQRLVPIVYPATPNLSDLTSNSALQFLLDVSLKVSQSNCPAYPFVPPEGFKIVTQLPRVGNPMYGYLLESADTYLLVFTGTMLLSEWIDDFRFVQTAWPYLTLPSMLVHSGFLSIYSRVRTDLLSAVRKDKPIIVTGHSLGGALSILSSFDLVTLGYEVRNVSFASPRVGNNVFADAFNEAVDSNRYFNTEDLVPSLPPAVLGKIIYTQVGTDRPFTRNLGSYVKNHVRAYVENFTD